jgi:hypothetical protein
MMDGMGHGAPPPHFERLRQESENLRADSMRTRIMSIHAYLSITEEQIKVRWIDHARRSLERIRGSVDEIDRHLQEPRYVPSALLDELCEMAQDLRKKMNRLEESIAGR